MLHSLLSKKSPPTEQPTLWLAPMEGVIDFIMREFLTNFGGIDHCMTEFIRVVDQPISDSVFFRDVPELQTQGKTAAGVSVTVQLLGSDANWLSQNANRAVELGAKDIDLNFGCPAKTVNRHDGGATLLKSPDRLYQITSEVRKKLPAHIPLSAKMRLGYENPEDCLENAAALAAGGVSHLTVHCRTKKQMYAPSADWTWLKKIRQKIQIPLIANGDIFSVADFKKCQDLTECDSFMIGRGALQDPLLFVKIKGLVEEDAQISSKSIQDFFRANCAVSPHFAQARTKQWLKNMTGKSEKMSAAFEKLKVITEPANFEQELQLLFEKSLQG